MRSIKALLFAFLCSAGLAAFTPPATAQTASGWDRVRALPPGAALHVKAEDRGAHCRLKSADADALTCVSGDGKKTQVFQKAEIRSIKVPHRGRSAAAGAAIGAGVGAAVGAGLGQNGQIIGRGGLAAIFAIPLAVLGGLVGVSTDFTVSTIYKR